METLHTRLAPRFNRSCWFALGAVFGLSESSARLFRMASRASATLQRKDPTRGAFTEGYDFTADKIVGAPIAVRFANSVSFARGALYALAEYAVGPRFPVYFGLKRFSALARNEAFESGYFAVADGIDRAISKHGRAR